MTSDRLAAYLTIRILYPKSERMAEVLSAVRNVSEAARAHEGLIEIGAWQDREHERLVNISLWESKELAMKATKDMHAKFADIPWAEWERQPAENYLSLTRVV